MIPIESRYYTNAVIVIFTIGSIFVFSQTLLAQSKRSFESLKSKNKNTLPTPHNQSDSLRNAGTNAEPLAPEADSVDLFIPLFNHGSVFLTKGNYYKKITKKDILWEDYFGLFDILSNNLPSYPLSQGGYFLNDNLSIFGAGARSNSFRFNNRPINEANFGTFNINMFPTEFFESAEIMLGSDAVIFSNNSSGVFVNLQEIRYNVATPYTKLWLEEAGKTMLSSDGVFSQNIMPNVNMTLGFRAINSSGDFINQWVDSWNVRGLVRWNLNEKTNISLSDNFHNYATGTNGGINTELSTGIYNPRESFVLYDSLNERLFRHDLNLTFSSILSDDTSSAVSMTAFFTNADYEQRVPGTITESDTVTHNQLLSNQTGISGKYEQELSDFLSLKFGGDIIYSAVDKGLFNDEMNGLTLGTFAYTAIRPIDKINISGGVRINSQLDRVFSSLGGKLQYSFTPYSSFFADISFSERVPTPTEGLALNNEGHFLLLAGYNTKNKQNIFEATIFFRNIANQIIARSVTDKNAHIINTRSEQNGTMRASGAYISYASEIFKHLHYRIYANLALTNNGAETDFSNPRLNGKLKFYYQFIVGKSEMRLGMDISAVYQKSWFRYFPQHRQYTLIENNPLAQFNGFNIFAHAKLGNAYLKLNLRNITGNGYYFLAYYPKSSFYFNLSVNWAFLD